MGEVVYRLVRQHDLTYAIEMKTVDGTSRLIKGFAWEKYSDTWIAEQQQKAPTDEVWIRRRLKSWRCRTGNRKTDL